MMNHSKRNDYKKVNSSFWHSKRVPCTPSRIIEIRGKNSLKKKSLTERAKMQIAHALAYPINCTQRLEVDGTTKTKKSTMWMTFEFH